MGLGSSRLIITFFYSCTQSPKVPTDQQQTHLCLKPKPSSQEETAQELTQCNLYLFNKSIQAFWEMLYSKTTYEVD